MTTGTDDRFADLLAAHTGGSSDPAAIDAALAEMATAGYPWEMFSAAGNAACSAELADILARRDELTADTLAGVFSQALVTVAKAGFREVGDTEPETHFADAANLLAARNGWPPVSRADFTAHLSVIDAARDAQRAAEVAATDALREKYRAEYDRLVADEVARRTQAAPSSPR